MTIEKIARLVYIPFTISSFQVVSLAIHKTPKIALFESKFNCDSRSDDRSKLLGIARKDNIGLRIGHCLDRDKCLRLRGLTRFVYKDVRERSPLHPYPMSDRGRQTGRDDNTETIHANSCRRWHSKMTIIVNVGVRTQLVWEAALVARWGIKSEKFLWGKSNLQS